MMKYWGLVLHMGIVKKPELRQYWSTDILYQTPVFGMVMNRKRFEAIHTFLHFRDNTDILPRDDPNFDRLFKIRPVIEHFSNKFTEVYIPQREICVDESLIHFKGRLQFRQYLPSKRARYGIKLYKICESTSGYTLSFRVYQGKDSSIQPPDCPPALGVNNNGLLSFNTSISTYTPQALPLPINNPILAPFWADVFNVYTGNIFYRQSSEDTGLLACATSNVRNYTHDKNFQAQWVFVATWDHVPYYGSTSNKVNTFQAVIITDGRSTYCLFNYAEIQWTTGTASGGNNATGLGGTPALAGLNNVNGTSYYTIPGSLSPAILNISSTSNVNFPGRWAFKLDEDVIVPLSYTQDGTSQYVTTTINSATVAFGPTMRPDSSGTSQNAPSPLTSRTSSTNWTIPSTSLTETTTHMVSTQIDNTGVSQTQYLRSSAPAVPKSITESSQHNTNTGITISSENMFPLSAFSSPSQSNPTVNITPSDVSTTPLVDQSVSENSSTSSSRESTVEITFPDTGTTTTDFHLLSHSTSSVHPSETKTTSFLTLNTSPQDNFSSMPVHISPSQYSSTSGTTTMESLSSHTTYAKDFTPTDLPSTLTVDISSPIELQTSELTSTVDFTSTGFPGTLTLDISSTVESQTSYLTSLVDFTSSDIRSTLSVDISSPIESQTTDFTSPADFTSSDIPSTLSVDISSSVESQTLYLTSPADFTSTDLPSTPSVDISSPVESQTTDLTSPADFTATDIPSTLSVDISSSVESQTSDLTSPADFTSTDIPIESQTSDLTSRADFTSTDIPSTLSVDISSSAESQTTILTSPLDFKSTDSPDTLTVVISSPIESHTSDLTSTVDITSSYFPVTHTVDISSPVESHSSELTSPVDSTSADLPSTLSVDISSPIQSQTSNFTSLIVFTSTDFPVDLQTSEVTSPVDFSNTLPIDISSTVESQTSNLISTVDFTSTDFPGSLTTDTSSAVESQTSDLTSTEDFTSTYFPSTLTVDVSSPVESQTSDLTSQVDFTSTDFPGTSTSIVTFSTLSLGSTPSGEATTADTSSTMVDNVSVMQATNINPDTTPPHMSSPSDFPNTFSVDTTPSESTPVLDTSVSDSTYLKTYPREISSAISIGPSPFESTWPVTKSFIPSSSNSLQLQTSTETFTSSTAELLLSEITPDSSTTPSPEFTDQVSINTDPFNTIFTTIPITTFTTTPTTTTTTTPTTTTFGTTVPHLFNGTNLLYPFGPIFDQLSPKVDDGGTGEIYLSIKLCLFGKVYDYLYMNNNGLLSFYWPIWQYVPEQLPVVTYNNPFLAVFWADVDNRFAGDIYYRMSTDPELLARATSDIRMYFRHKNFTANWAFVATWDRVPYYAAIDKKVNTFQCVLVTDGTATYVLFNYEDMQWPLISGYPLSMAGLNSGYNTSYYVIPDSFSPSIVNISSTSNVGVPGRWVFKVDQLYIEQPNT
ncbi:unnamed protein product, partial [Ranitomeya imitator]